ncbi:MAG: NAD(P)/FAD-dependent oxidoreductase [Candidatus Altiarchaeales archaeon]|nr:MAG: NAD(P)/FAD-dependent oxidoreductase [Candidatus Altiarchaeales archaeon]
MNDVIVVGAGISGLLSALVLAKEGKRVLVLEKAGHVGGVCRSYNVDGYRVDTGPHVITRTEYGPLKELMDKYFDVVPNFVPHGGYYVRLNNRIKPFPWNLYGWFNFDLIPQIDRLYLIKTLFSISYISNSGESLSRKSVGDLVGNGLSDSTMRFLNCMSYFMTGTSMNETPVARFLDSEHYKSLSKNPLDRIYNILMKEGAFDHVYPKGGLQSLITAILSSLPKNRVKIKTNEEVVKITDDTPKGVETDKNEYKCNTVIYSGFASDLPELVDGLSDEYKRSLKKLHKTDALTIWLGLNKKIFARNGSEIWVDSDPYTWVVPASNYDPLLAPTGKQLVGFAFRLPRDCNLKREKKKALQAIFNIMPEIENHIEMRHYQVLIPEKAAWTIDTVFADVKTPIDGIYLVGTDTERRSMGITRASYSVLNLISVLKKEGVLR